MQTIKVAHFRLTFSRQMFVVAYPRETQEMVFDAHNRAFAFFGGVPLRMVYDNLKAVVEAIFIGKERLFNRRYMALPNYYLFEPVACTPASGWKKGQVENQVGNIREWLFTPLARFSSFEALNDWLATRSGSWPSASIRRPRRYPARLNLADCFSYACAKAYWQAESITPRRFSSLRSINRHNRRTGSGRRLCTLTNDKQYKPCGQRHARATSGQNHGHAPKNLDFHSGRPCRLWLFRRQLRQTGI